MKLDKITKASSPESIESGTQSAENTPGGSASSGMFWMFLTTGIGKVATLCTQIVLGWVLSKEDFGLYALALSIATVVSILRNGGTLPILIQRGNSYPDLAPFIVKFAFFFNFAAFFILLLIAPLTAKLYDAPQLTWMIAFIALSFLLMTPSLIFRAKLSIDKRFKTFSLIDLSSNVIRQGSMMIFALLGLGPLSFVLPVAAEPVFWAIAGWFCIKQWPKKRRLTFLKFKQIFKESRWVMLGAFGISVTQNGDYFIIALFESKADLGTYFFALQLTVTVSVLFLSSIQAVVLPTLAPLKNDLPKLMQTFEKALRSINFISVPVAIALFLAIDPLVTVLWQGKWNDAIPIAEVLSLSIPASLLISLSRTLTEARGNWGYRLILISGYGFGGMTIAAASCYLGDLVLIATSICIFRWLFAFTQCLLVGRIVNLNFGQVLASYLPPVVLSGLSGLVANSICELAIAQQPAIIKQFILLTCFAIAYIFFSLVFFKRQTLEIFNSLRTKTRKSGAISNTV